MKLQKIRIKTVNNIFSFILAVTFLNLFGVATFAAQPKKFLQRYSCQVDKKMENHQWRRLKTKGRLYSERISNRESRIVLKEDKHKIEMTVPFVGRPSYGPINIVRDNNKLKLAAVNRQLVGQIESKNKKYRVSCTQ